MSDTCRLAFTPTIDTAAFPGTPSAYFWSSTVKQGDPTNAWNVYDNGEVTPNAIAGAYSARCVR